MSNDRRDLQDLFRSDINRIELPPQTVWLPRMTPRVPRRWDALSAFPAALGVVAFALVIAFVIQATRGALPPNVASPPSPSTITSTPIPASPLPTSLGKPLGTGDPIRVHNTLPRQGQWALVLASSGSGDWSSSIVAVPLSGQRTEALHLISFSTSGDRNWTDAWNLLRTQLSPDGRRVVLSVTVQDGTFLRLGLVIVDLVTGTITPLTTDRAYHDVSPAWNPKGDEIAFVRLGSTPARQSPSGPIYPTPQAGIWMVHADGTALRELVGPPPEVPNPISSSIDVVNNTALYGWNAAGTALGFSQGPGVALMYKLLEISTGTVTQLGAHAVFWAATRGGGDWREGRPAFVGTFVDWPAGSSGGFVPYHIDVAEDQLGRGARTVFDAAADVNMHLGGARWRPGSSDVLYVGSLFEGSKRTMNLFVTDATGRTPREIKSVSPAQLAAAWTPDGRDIVWVEALGNAAAVHLMRPDGTNERFVTSFALPGLATVDLGLDLVVLGF